MNSKYDKVVHLVGAQKTNSPWGFENRLIPAFESLGCKVISTDFRRERSRLPELLLKEADIVLVCKGEGISPQLVSSVPYVTALWYAEQIGTSDHYDDLSLFRRNELSFNVSAFDYVFTHDQGNLDVCQELGAKKTAWLSCAAVDPGINCKLDSKKQYDVVFVGSNTPRRRKILSELRRRGINVHSPNLWDPKELNRLFNESRIVLNIHLSELLNTETRLAEVLGSGSFLLSEKISSPDLLVEGTHYVTWFPGNTDELIDKITYYLSHETERERIASEGYHHIHEHHTYEKHVKTLLDSIDFDLNRRIWPSHGLGFLFDSQGQPTLRLDSFYSAVSGALAEPGVFNRDIEGPSSSTGRERPSLHENPKSFAQDPPSPHPQKAVRITSQKGPLRIFAAFSNVNWEDSNLQPALEHFGEVIRFRWDFYDQYRPDWHFTEKAKMNRGMLETLKSAHQEKSIDLFFGYLSGRTVFPGIIRSIGQLGIPTLSLSLDDKAKFFGTLEPTGYTGMVDIANAFTLCWTSTEDAVEKYNAAGAKAIYLPAGANPEVFKPYDLPRDIDVSFIGQKYGQRPPIIEELRKRGIDVKAFGRGWEKGEISAEEMVKIYSRSKITLGFAGVGDSEEIFCLKGRDFEVPMSGGFYLTQYHSELERWFELGKEIVCYRDIDDMA
ncbi:MAG: glycosyltransferase, partial [Desulfobacteraceae bacterium]|nr:glycosyltransferase [Desulfobacteraceae bacterium]